MQVIGCIRRSSSLSLCFLAFIMLLAVYSDATNSSPNSRNLLPTLEDGYATVHGCPSNAVVTRVSATINVIVNSTQMNRTILVHNGDVIAIRFPFGRKWTGPIASQGILQILAPAGYASQADHACIWLFFVRGAGTTQLVFHSWALCPINQMCPMYIAEGATPDTRVTFLISTIRIK